MTDERLQEIREANEWRRKIKAATSPGPWHVINPDDAMAMNVFAVSTSEFNDGDMDDHYTEEEARQIVAITLLQTPRFASSPEYLNNAEFIASSKNDPVEDVVDSLLAEIDRLKAELAEARKDTARLDYYARLASDMRASSFQRYISLCRKAEHTGLRKAIDAVAGQDATWLQEPSRTE